MASLHPVAWFGCTGGLYLKNRLPSCNGRGQISQKASPKRQNHPSSCKNHHDLLMGPATTCIAKDTPFLHYSKPITHLGTEEIPTLTSLWLWSGHHHECPWPGGEPQKYLHSGGLNTWLETQAAPTSCGSSAVSGLEESFSCPKKLSLHCPKGGGKKKKGTPLGGTSYLMAAMPFQA